MEDSILSTTKKALGLNDEYKAFDRDIVMHINSVLTILTQLGVGPTQGFMIDGENTTWAQFMGTDMRFNSVKSYMFLKVRLLFDPPSSSFHIEALKEQASELEWRISEQRELNKINNQPEPIPVPIPEEV